MGMIQPPAWAADYIGIPFVDRGRTLYGCDCWGLVRMVLRDMMDVTMPEYSVSEADHAQVQHEIVAAQASGDWTRVVEERAYDIAEMTLPVYTQDGWQHLPLHVGVIVAPGWVLHTARATGSILETYKRDPSVMRRIRGFWRHKELLDVA